MVVAPDYSTEHYTCKICEHSFSATVYKYEVPRCPKCGSDELKTTVKDIFKSLLGFKPTY